MNIFGTKCLKWYTTTVVTCFCKLPDFVSFWNSAAKSAVYQALILNLLFYGSECWALSSQMLKRLCSFHRRCVRTMCGCSLNMGVVTYSRSGCITSHAELEQRMCMPDIATLLSPLATVGRAHLDDGRRTLTSPHAHALDPYCPTKRTT